MFISFLYMFRATMCPSSGEITVSMQHFVFVTLCGWLSGLQGGIQITNTKCRIDTVISPDDGHIVARNMYRKEINILSKIVHQVGFIYKIIQGYSRWLLGFLQLVIHNTLEIGLYVFFYLIEQHCKFLLHTLLMLFENF